MDLFLDGNPLFMFKVEMCQNMAVGTMCADTALFYPPGLALQDSASSHRKPPGRPPPQLPSPLQEANTRTYYSRSSYRLSLSFTLSLLHLFLPFGTKIRLLVNAMMNMWTILKIALLLRQSGPDEAQIFNLVSHIPLLKSSQTSLLFIKYPVIIITLVGHFVNIFMNFLLNVWPTTEQIWLWNYQTTSDDPI